MDNYEEISGAEKWVLEEGTLPDIRKVEGLAVYQSAMELGEIVWKQVHDWDFFARDTIGKQLVRSSDSVAANIAEGYGRFSFKENLRFCYYARGSLVETRTWLQKAIDRGLIKHSHIQELPEKAAFVHKLLNGYIRYIRKSVSESSKR